MTGTKYHEMQYSNMVHIPIEHSVWEEVRVHRGRENVFRKARVKETPFEHGHPPRLVVPVP